MNISFRIYILFHIEADFIKKICRGRDLNPRTSAGQGPEPCAVGQAWLPLHQEIMLQREKMMRTPGFEPGLRAWKALIITPRSHPQN